MNYEPLLASEATSRKAVLPIEATVKHEERRDGHVIMYTRKERQKDGVL